MDGIKEISKIYTDNLVEAVSITGLGQQTVDIAKRQLEILSNDPIVKNTYSVRTKVEADIAILNNLFQSNLLGGLLPIIYRQQVVLLVSSFEAFMSDLVRCIGNNYRKIICWPGESSKDILRSPIDLSLLRSDAITIGDLVLSVVEQRQTSFQDLQSTLNFLRDYLSIDISVNGSTKDLVILATSMRHLIVHCGSKVDSRFLQHIRETSFASKYKDGSALEISEKQVRDIMNAFLKLGILITKAISDKIAEVKST